MADISVAEEFLQEASHVEDIKKDDESLLEDIDKKVAPKRRKTKSSQENSEARRESHKLIEQKRRQKINEKINELRELLNYPDGSQNKAVVLQSAVENIRYLKLVCNKLAQHHRQLQEENITLMTENERLRKLLSDNGIITASNTKPTTDGQLVPQSQDQLASLGLDKSNGDLTGLAIANGKTPNGIKAMATGVTYGSPASASMDVLRGMTNPADMGFLYSDDNHPHTISVLSNLASPIGLAAQSRAFGNAGVIQPGAIPVMANASIAANSQLFTDGSLLNGTQSVPNTPSAVNVTNASPANGTSPLTSTETENGVSITRLLFSGS